MKTRFSGRFVLPMILGLTLMYGCAEKDYYDPDFGGGKKEKPLDLEVPANMDWEILGTADITVDVKDEYNGQYNYLIEILDADPANGEGYKVLDAGVAKQGKPYTTQIEYIKGIEKKVYIRETTPVGRVSITPRIISEIETTSTRSMTQTRTGSTDVPEEYKEESYNTSDAIELKGNEDWNQWDHYIESGKSYIIKKGETFTGVINHSSAYLNGGTFTLYIQGTWQPAAGSIQSANIIVLNGGKLDTQSHSSFLIADKSSLTIQKGGNLIGKDFCLATNVLAKNFGDITVETMRDLNTGSVLYNAKGANIKVTGNDTPDSNTIAVFTKGGISNFGTFVLDSKNNPIFKINSQDKTCHFYNGKDARIEVPEFIFGGIGINDGTIKCTNFKNDQGNPTFTNNCNIFACGTFEFIQTYGTLILNKGAISGGINKDGSFAPVPSVNCSNSPTIQMNNGSMIKATAMSLTDTKIIGGEGNVSLLKSETPITFGWTTKFSGNMVVECIAYNNGQALNSEGIKRYEPGKSGIIISTCDGDGGDGTETPDTPPHEPTEPDFPIEIEKSSDYTFAMEDQWPSYGDYDMNDVVVGISPKVKITNYGDMRYVENVKFKVKVMAVGALKQIAAAIQLDNVSPGQIQKVTYKKINADKLLGKSFYLNANGVEAGQDKAVIPLFENANQLLGGNYVNVGDADERYMEADPIEFEVIVQFNITNNTVKPEDLNYKNLNFFIMPNYTKIVDRNRRVEIHLAGYEPTNLANPDLFGTGVDKGGSSKYISEDNFVWGMIIPTDDWECPDEMVNIRDTYKYFEDWVMSAGKQHSDWYEDKD